MVTTYLVTNSPTGDEAVIMSRKFAFHGEGVKDLSSGHDKPYCLFTFM